MECNKLTFAIFLLKSGAYEIAEDDARVEIERLVVYLNSQGKSVSCGCDVYTAIRTLPSEDEIGAEWCREGVAFTHASEGWAVLIPFDAPLSKGFLSADGVSRDGGAC